MQTMFSLVFHLHCSSVDVVVITEISFFCYLMECVLTLLII